MRLSPLYLRELLKLLIRKPAVTCHVLYHILLVKVQTVVSERKLAKLRRIAAASKSSAGAFEAETSACVHDHNGLVGPLAVGRQTQFAFYLVKRYTPTTLAVVRYTTWTEHGTVLEVAEEYFEDCPEELQRLEHEVMAALHSGVDVIMQSWYEIGTFPHLAELVETA